MELSKIDEFRRSGATNSLFGDVDELAARVNQFRPMSPDVVEAVRAKLFPERVYSSNAIEGNTLSLRETIEILVSGHVSDKRRREGTEALNLGAAVRQLESELLPAPDPHEREKFLTLHGTLMNGLTARAGDYRLDRRMIAGAKHQPPRPELVPQLVERMLEELKRSVGTSAHPVCIAAWAHWAIARIHPFEDGNGRMARLWQDLILLRANLAPAIIRLQDRDQNGYYDALASGDEGDLNLLAQLIAQRTAATLNDYIAAQQQVGVLSDWAEKIAGEAAVRASESRKAQYLRWSMRMEALRNDFQRCVARLTSSGLQLQIRPYPLIDENAWENLRSGLGASNTWFFIISTKKGIHRYAYFFFFGQHFWSAADTDDDRSEPRVALLVSEQVDQEKPKPLYLQQNMPIELREIFATETSMVAVYERPDGTREYVRDVDPMKLAMKFIEDVVLRRLS